MSRIVKFILVCVFSTMIAANISAQGRPSLEMTCPDHMITAGEKVVLKAALNPPAGMAVFNWTLSAGKIIKGQGTSTIEVETPADYDAPLTVTVDMGRNVYVEPLTESCTVSLALPPKARMIDEFEAHAPGYVKQHMEYLARELANDPTVQAMIVIFPKSNRDAGYSERMVRDAIKFFHLDVSRLTIKRAENNCRRMMQWWMIPPGAEAPKADLSDQNKCYLPTPRHLVQANSSACELNSLYLDNLRAELAHDPNQTVRIVFSPGISETAAVNLKRQKIFMEHVKNRLPEAEYQIGETTKSDGEVAIYLRKPGGTEEFYLLIYAIKNKSVCLSCCNAADMPKNLLSEPKKKNAGKNKK